MRRQHENNKASSTQKQSSEWRVKRKSHSVETNVAVTNRAVDYFSLLPLDILLQIFQYLYFSETYAKWARLSSVNILFRDAINAVCYLQLSDQKWNVKLWHPLSLPPSFLAASKTSSAAFNRNTNSFCKKQLLSSNKSHNSSLSRFQPNAIETLTSFQIHYIPKLKLYDQLLLCSFGRVLYSFSPKSLDHTPYIPEKGLSKDLLRINRHYAQHQGDITDFLMCDPTNPDMILSSSVDGNIQLWNRRNNYIQRTFYGHKDVVNCLDSNQNLFVSGSFDGTVKLWDRSTFKNSATFHLKERVFSLKCNDSIAAAGIQVFHKDRHPLSLLDLQTTTILTKLEGHRSSVYDIQLLNSHDNNRCRVMSSSYDGTVKFWDNEKVVLSLDDPNDYPVYCAQYDDHWKVLTGTAYHSTFRTWDIRNPKEPLTTNFPASKTSKGVVYSIQADDGNIFVALSSGLEMFKLVN